MTWWHAPPRAPATSPFFELEDSQDGATVSNHTMAFITPKEFDIRTYLRTIVGVPVHLGRGEGKGRWGERGESP